MSKDDPARAAREARLIARGALKGALATTRRAARPSAQGQPYVSKVGVALDEDGAPLFLFSTLAAHTQDVLADDRVALLLEAPTDAANPLEGARCTLIGRVRKLEGADAARARARYLAHHPGAAMYAGFGDFAMWRMAVDKIQYVGGFGVAKWAKGADYLCPSLKYADTLIDSLNSQRKDELAAVVRAATGRAARGWAAVAVDGDGVAVHGPKGRHARIDFPSFAKDLSAWRGRFRGCVKRAQRT